MSVDVPPELRAEAVHAELSDALRERGLYVTAQRVAVAAAVSAHPHATADVIIDVVREDLGTVSRQAVYDTLGAFVEHDLIRRIQPAGSVARYEDRVGDNHHHLVCRDCATVIDIDCAVGDTPCLVADEDHGFEIDEAEVVYWGRCPACVTARDSQQYSQTRSNKQSP